MKISPKNRNVLIFLLIISLVIIITRVPLYPDYFYHIDCGNFILALDDYDIAASQPQPPGYYGFVALGNLSNLVFNNPHLAYLALSTLSNIFLSVTLFFLARRMFGVTAAVITTILSMISPVFWFNSIVAFSYMTAAAFAVLFAYLVYDTYTKRDWRAAIYSSAILGLLGGIRQDCLIIFFPLWILSIRALRKKQVLYCSTILLLFVLLWFLPMVSMSGGLDSYLSAVDKQYSGRVQSLSVFSDPSNAIGNLTRMSKTIINTVSLMGIVILFYATVLIIRRKCTRLLRDKRIIFLTIWFFPAFFFYLLIHFTNPGYIIPVLPALLIILASSIVLLAKIFSRSCVQVKRRITVLLTLLVSVILIYTFLFYSPGGSDIYASHSHYSDIQLHDRVMDSEVAFIKSEYASSETTLLADSAFYFGLQHLRYYLPDYESVEITRYLPLSDMDISSEGIRDYYTDSDSYSELFSRMGSETYPFTFHINEVPN